MTRLVLLTTEIDVLVSREYGAYAPRWGWHDDHRAADGTSDYLPALMQVRSETSRFWSAMDDLMVLGPDSRCLQLGMGSCGASHDALRLGFGKVITIDFGVVRMGDGAVSVDYPGLDTRSGEAVDHASRIGLAPFDMVMFDASHTYVGISDEFRRYGPMVRPGGVMAFHDALPRTSHPEVEVWRFLSELDADVRVIGDEVGVAWMRA